MKLIALATACALILPLVAKAAESSVPPVTQAAAIHSARSFDFISRINGASYEVSIYVPKAPVPAHGFPTLYLLDGSNVFGTFVNAMSNEGFVHEVEPAVVVGISSGPGERAANRTYDFTPRQLSEEERNVIVDLGAHPLSGGYDDFFRVIQEEIKPRVASLASLDRRRDILFGWSLGGQVVVHTMLTHPETFAAYAALSPSLWYANRSVFSEIAGFEAKIAASGQPVALWLGVGSLEQEVSPGFALLPLDQDKMAKELTYVRMVGNMLDLTAALRPFFNQHALAISSHVFDGETHNTVPWAAVNPILRFVLPMGQVK